jgi:hypothetical protein
MLKKYSLVRLDKSSPSKTAFGSTAIIILFWFIQRLSF